MRRESLTVMNSYEVRASVFAMFAWTSQSMRCNDVIWRDSS